MNYHIVQNGRRRQHKPPVEGESSLGAAAPPAGLLIPDGDAVVSAVGELPEISRPFREVFFGGGDIPLGQGGTLGVRQIRDGPGCLLLLHFKIFRDDPVLSVREDMPDLFIAGPQGNAYRDLSFRRDADRVALPVTADEGVGKFI